MGSFPLPPTLRLLPGHRVTAFSCIAMAGRKACLLPSGGMGRLAIALLCFALLCPVPAKGQGQPDQSRAGERIEEKDSPCPRSPVPLCTPKRNTLALSFLPLLYGSPSMVLSGFAVQSGLVQRACQFSDSPQDYQD